VTVYPLVGKHIAHFLAQTLFHTSDLFLKSADKRKKVTTFLNNACIHITEQVVFTEPYITHKNNHWTDHPDVHHAVAEIQSDTELKIHAAELKDKFMNHTQALIHGDLHTGSIMVTQEKTIMIDPEFAFYGPMGFDVGAIIGNFFLSFFCQDGLAKQDNIDKKRGEYKKWLVETSIQIWELFQKEFLELWNQKAGSGEGFNIIQSNQQQFQVLQSNFLEKLFEDTLGFMAMKMIRRIIGIAHVADLESIKDLPTRASCEVKALQFARKIAKDRKKGHYKSIRDVVKELN